MGRISNTNPPYPLNSGKVNSGGKLFFFDSGTTTPRDTFSDEDLTNPNTNPIILNSAGRSPVNIFLDSGLYRLKITNADESVQLSQEDGISALFASGSDLSLNKLNVADLATIDTLSVITGKVETVNFDNLVTGGSYQVSAAAANAPDAGRDWHVEVTPLDAINFAQMAVSRAATPRMFWRVNNNSTFSAWAEAGPPASFPLLADVSSVTAPSYSFAGDSDMGMYRIAVNVLGFSTGGIEAMRIDNSQKVNLIKQLIVDDGGSKFTDTSAFGGAVSANIVRSDYGGSAIGIDVSRPATNLYQMIKATSGGNADTEWRVAGDGNVFADQAFTGGGADYAIMLEWLDGNPANEDRVGQSVVVINGKMRRAVDGEIPRWVISANAAFVENGDMDRWKKKYLKDDFGRTIFEDYTVIEWAEIVEPAIEEVRLIGVWIPSNGTKPKGYDPKVGFISQPAVKEVVKKHSYEYDKIPDDVVVPPDATTVSSDSNGPLTRRELNPLWNPGAQYIPRSDRPEWDQMGRMGLLRVLKGEQINPNWVFCREISDTVEEWLI